MILIEKVVKDFLDGKVDCPVLLEDTEGRAIKRVLIEKTSGRGEFTYESTLAIQSYGRTLYEASVLNQTVISLLLKEDDGFGLLSERDVLSVELNSNYNYTDTSTKEYRYQAVFDIRHY